MTEFPIALKGDLALVGHAYILEGGLPDRLIIGRAFAKRLNCQATAASGRADACGECLSCRVFESGNHPDIFFVTGTKATGIGVDDVRDQIVSRMVTQPFKYRYKIFIVDKAETLTPAAQNALLKTIEEPAAYGVFLFLAEHVHTLLPTLLSRCALVKLGETATIPSTEALALAKEIASTIAGMDVLTTMGLYRRFEPYKESRESLASLLDMLYLTYAKQVTHAAVTGEIIQNIWYDSITAIQHTKQVLAQNGNFQLAIELMLLKLSGVSLTNNEHSL
ncbi:MAG: hypothetical protein FWC77_00990 [Defluviitaleaceae bacterium]|nr:hypothetical protein [Defluviitaleaceae bacterium]